MKLLKKIFWFLIIFGILALGSLVFLGYRMYEEAVSEINLETKILNIKAEEGYTNFDNLPKDYINAVIATEDHRFYNHKGIDIVSLSRAIINNVKEGKIVEGGSTITQQVAKNLYFTQKQSLVRKIAEVFVVYELEKNYTKNEIFELYVNISYFGDGYYGVGEAANGYLNKKVEEMTLLECTLLAGIPNAPSIYAPTKNPDLSLQRQKQVIRKMIEKEYLTDDEANMLYQKME